MNNKKLFKIAVASGKGGVGKSMLSSVLAMLFAQEKKIVACDCDVDAPNMNLWLNEIDNWQKTIPLSTNQKPEFDLEKCDGCGLCVQNCQFSALDMVSGKPELNQYLCEGCSACKITCPNGAIKLKSVENGEIKIKKTKYGFPLVLGQLYPGETGSGKIVDRAKEEALKFESDIMVVDSSPGTGCPVIASLKDMDFVVLITEPTISGFADIKKILKVIEHFQIPWNMVINKWDINCEMSKEIENWSGKKFLGRISFDKEIFKAVSDLRPILETNLRAKKEIEVIFNNLKKK